MRERRPRRTCDAYTRRSCAACPSVQGCGKCSAMSCQTADGKGSHPPIDEGGRFVLCFIRCPLGRTVFSRLVRPIFIAQAQSVIGGDALHIDAGLYNSGILPDARSAMNEPRISGDQSAGEPQSRAVR